MQKKQDLLCKHIKFATYDAEGRTGLCDTCNKLITVRKKSVPARSGQELFFGVFVRETFSQMSSII